MGQLYHQQFSNIPAHTKECDTELSDMHVDTADLMLE
jgi:hypothetical protein